MEKKRRMNTYVIIGWSFLLSVNNVNIICFCRFASEHVGLSDNNEYPLVFRTKVKQIRNRWEGSQYIVIDVEIFEEYIRETNSTSIFVANNTYHYEERIYSIRIVYLFFVVTNNDNSIYIYMYLYIYLFPESCLSFGSYLRFIKKYGWIFWWRRAGRRCQMLVVIAVTM